MKAVRGLKSVERRAVARRDVARDAEIIERVVDRQRDRRDPPEPHDGEPSPEDREQPEFRLPRGLIRNGAECTPDPLRLLLALWRAARDNRAASTP